MTLILSGTDGLSDIDGSAATPAIRGTDANTGVFFPAADTMAVATGGTERARVDASGNLGLGVTPKSGSGGVPAFEISGSGTGFTSQGAFNAFSQNAYYASGWKYAATGAAASYWQDGGVHKWFTAPSGTANNAISFTQAMTLDSSGNLLVGTTSQPISGIASRFAVSYATGDFVAGLRNTNAAPYGLIVNYSTTPNAAGNEFLFCSDSTTIRMAVRSNGGIANYSANNANLSDRREKTNFAPAGEYLSKICAIPVQTYNYIDQNIEDDPGLTLGVVAQDVQAVAPELIMESNWGTEDEPKMRLSIYQTDLQYALMKCIQEQQSIITALTARIDALEGK